LESRREAGVSRCDPKDAQEVFGLPADLEGRAGRLAAGRAGEADLARLRSDCEDVERAVSVKTRDCLEVVNRPNAAFPRGVLDGCAKPRLASTVQPVTQRYVTERSVTERSLTERSLTQRALRVCAPADPDRRGRRHREPTDAIGAGDPGGAEACTRSRVYARRFSARRPPT
jgi:DNA-binding GntR family transcriptional regulator